MNREPASYEVAVLYCDSRFATGPCFLWSGRRDLNPRPPDPKSGALPSCATPGCCRSFPTVTRSTNAPPGLACWLIFPSSCSQNARFHSGLQRHPAGLAEADGLEPSRPGVKFQCRNHLATPPYWPSLRPVTACAVALCGLVPNVCAYPHRCRRSVVRLSMAMVHAAMLWWRPPESNRLTPAAAIYPTGIAPGPPGSLVGGADFTGPAYF